MTALVSATPGASADPRTEASGTRSAARRRGPVALEGKAGRLPVDQPPGVVADPGVAVLDQGLDGHQAGAAVDVRAVDDDLVVLAGGRQHLGGGGGEQRARGGLCPGSPGPWGPPPPGSHPPGPLWPG